MSEVPLYMKLRTCKATDACLSPGEKGQESTFLTLIKTPFVWSLTPSYGTPSHDTQGERKRKREKDFYSYHLGRLNPEL